MRASTRSACALIAIVVLGLATQAKGQDIADAENRAAVDEHPCSKDLHTEACSDSCTMQDTCNRHGRCRGNTGLCECFAGWSGAGCDIADPCVQDVYAQGCTAECSMEDTCNNHGRCLGDGSCACFPGFSGTNCNTGGGGDDPCGKDIYAEGCTDRCSTEYTCSNHGRCLGDGSCACFPGWIGEECSARYGSGDPCGGDLYAEVCSAECSMEGTCSNHGRCLGDGACACFSGWTGEDCNTVDGGGDPCFMDIYAAGCTAECSMEDTCNNHGRCMGDGSCACYTGWRGDYCDTVGGGDPCAGDLYSTECSAACTMEHTCSRQGRCMGDGSCKCFAGFSGDDCAVQDATPAASCIAVLGSDDCACAAGFTGPDGGPCSPCQPGEYKAGNGSALCKPCADGTYAASTLATSDATCEACPMDSWCAAGLRNDCLAHGESSAGSSSAGDCTCAAGREIVTDGEGGSCQPCAAGTSKGAFGREACQPCDANFFCVGGAASERCPLHSESVTSSESVADCTCLSGFTDVSTAGPVQCEKPPGAPSAVIVTQKTAPGTSATRFSVTWSAPADFGDGKAVGAEDRTVLAGYTVVVGCVSGGSDVTIPTGSTLTSLDLSASWTGDAFVLTHQTSTPLNCNKGDTVSAKVSARNLYLTGIFSAAAEVTAVGLPAAPSAAIVTQRTAVSPPGTFATFFSVTWTAPGDYGDGKTASDKDRTALAGYTVKVECGSGGSVATIPTGSTLTLLDLSASWTGDAFVLSHQSSTPLNCNKGDTVSAKVSASNLYLPGPSSAAAKIIAMGLPGAVTNVTAVKADLALHVSFQLPSDTGFGSSSEAAALESVAQASTCSSFDRKAECDFHEANNATGGAVALTGLTKGTLYYVRAFVRNLVGDSLIKTTQVFGWLTVPVLTDTSTVLVARPYPPSTAFHVWQNGAKRSTIALKLTLLPAALTPTDVITCDFNFTAAATPTSAATTETRSVWTTASAADSSDARTIDVPLPAALPSFCASGCSATLFVYPASDAAQHASLPVEFFNYARPAVTSVYPRKGSEQGGSVVSLTVEDYQGTARQPSRYMANLFNFFTAPALKVEVQCEGEALQERGASLTDTGNSMFEITFTAPPCDAGVANYTLATSSGNVLLDMGGLKALQFTYQGTVVSSVTPTSGMTNPGSAGVDMSLFINNVQTAPATTPTVTLAGVACVVSLSTFTPDNRQLMLKARTPELAVALAGKVSIVVSGVVAGKDLAFQWMYLAPPAMFLEAESFTIDDTQRTWVSASNSATVKIACVIRNLHAKFDRAFDALTLDVPQAETETVSFRSMGDDGKVTAAFTLDASALPKGFYSVSVGVYKDGVRRFNVSAFDLSARAGAWMEARDTTLPRLLSAAPTEAPAQGGTLLLLGFLEARSLQEQYAAGAVSFALRHESGSGVTEVNGTVEHVISLADYNAKGGTYNAALSVAGQFSQASESLFTAYLSIPTMLNAEVLFSTTPTQATSDAALLLVRTPLIAAGEKLRVSWRKAGAMQYHDFAFSVIAAPVGAAVVKQAYTDDLTRSSGLSGGVRLTIVVSNFPLVYSKTSLSVKFGDTSANVLRLKAGSSSGTRLTVLVPAGSPGVVDVTVAEKDFPSNAATFQFTYIDDRIPQASSFSPARVYADGGHTVTVIMTDFPDVQAASEVSADATAADKTELSFAVVSVAKSAAGVTTVVLTTTAGAAGKANVVIYTSAMKTRPSIILDLVAVPAGAPNVTLFAPSIGECRAGSPVTVSMGLGLSEFRQLPDTSNLRVTINGTSMTPRRVASFMTGTSFEFSAGVVDLDGGLYEVRAWSSTDLTKVAVSSFECTDTTVAKLVGAFPASGFAGSNTSVSVFLTDSGYAPDATVHLTQGGVTTPIAKAAIGGSPMEVVVTLTAATPGTSTMKLAPCADPSKDAACLKKAVSFNFTFLDPDAVRVTGFFPLSEYVSGRTEIDVKVKNLPTGLVKAQVILNFGASNATCSNIDNATGVLTFKIPTEPTATAGKVSLRLHLLASGESLELPRKFDYLEQKPAVITSVSPSKASIRTAGTVRIAVSNLPGVAAASDVGVELVWSDGRTEDLLVLSATRTDARKQVYAVQEWFADVTTPEDGDPDDADSMEVTAVTVRVIHRVFGSFVELQAGLALYDDALPQVTSVSGPDGVGQTSANVPMSKSSEVTITVSKAPDVNPSVYSALVGSLAPGVTFATVDVDGMAQVVLTSPKQGSAGEVHGLIVFGAVPSSTACVSSCCQTASCVVDCPGVQTACFSLVAYNDLVPIASVKSAVSGPKIGGAFILVSIANFPLLSSADDAEVSFAAAAGSLQLKSSSAEATVLTLVTPEYTTLGTASSAIVDVKVTPKKQPEQAIDFQYTYLTVSPAVTAFTPTSGLNDVVREVKVQIAYLPFPGTVLVTFGGVEVPSSVHASSNKKSSLVMFNTTKSLLGAIPVAIKPKKCLDPCVDQVNFTFTSLDASVPSLLAPPSGMASQQATLPKITLEKFPAQYSALAVTMVRTSNNTELACTVKTVDRIGALVQLDVDKPAAGLSDGKYSVRIEVTDTGGKKTVLIPSFVVYDGRAPKVVSYGPAEVPTVASAGGRLLQLRSRVSATMANFPQGLALSAVVATQGAEDVTVVEVRDLVKCSADAIDCERTLVTLLSPALASPGDKTFSVSAPGMSAPLTFAITFEPPCDFQALCTAKSQLVNYRRLLDAPTIACDPAYCIKAADISAPEILRVSPTEGFVVGGTLVTLQVSNLPAFSAADVKVVAGEGVTKAFGEVVSLTQEPGSSLTRSKGLLVLRTPAVDALSQLVGFTVSTKVDSESRSATFKFDYLPALSGATTFVQVSPASMYETTESDTVSLALSLGSVPRLARPFVLSDIMVKVGAGAYAPASKITSSDRDSTTVNVEASMALPAGTIDISAYSASRGIATAGVKTIDVVPAPAPSVVGAYPSDGSTDLAHTIAVTVQYVPPAFKLSDLTSAQLVASQKGKYPVEILSVENKNTKCKHTYCSLFEVKVRAPALNTTDNGGGAARFSAHNAAGAMFSWNFTYVASGKPEVLGFSPKWQKVVADAAEAAATEQTVTIFLRNFPRAGCTGTCKAEAERRSTRVRFTRGATPVDVTPSSITETAGMLSIHVVAPARGVSGDETLTVRAVADGDNALVETGGFAFAYVAPPRSVSPVDGSVEGGTVVTVKAYGFDPIPAKEDVSVVIVDGTSETTVDVLEVTPNKQDGVPISEMTLTLSMPAFASAGVFTCRIKRVGPDPNVLAEFLFEYFNPPLASNLEHGDATVEGQTGATDGASTALRISDFPSIASGADVAVTFGSVVSPVLSYTNFKGGVWLQVRVPAATAPGIVTLSITYTGTAPVPRGGVAGDTYVRAPKVASVDFTYFVPQPEVLAVRWCEGCQTGRTCLVNGRCLKGVRPKENSAPLRGVGTLTVVLRNMPVVPHNPLTGELAAAAKASISASLGSTSVASFLKVVFQDGDLSAFELSMPSASAGEVLAEMSVQPADAPVPTTASFTFTFFDDNIALSCSACRAPSSSAAPFRVTISSFLISTSLAASDQISVTFGSEAAAAVTIDSSNGTLTVLTVTPPSYECASCAYAGGMAAVELSVVSRTDASRGASAPFTFWSAPVVSAIAMDQLGLTLVVSFDHPTNRAAMGSKNQSCAQVFAAGSVFAKMTGITAPKCVWATDLTLNVFLGVSATLVPGDKLTLKASAVRSANLVSPYSESKATSVATPEFLKEPSLSVSGPTTIDQCSLLNLKAASDSPRPPDFAWRCFNHPGLNTALQAFTTSQVDLAGGTPDMTVLDITYEIGVTATDMFGSLSKEVMFTVFKAAAPAPQLYFQPASAAVTRDLMVEVRAVTVFSQCMDTKSEMLFKWAQVSGPTTIPAAYLGTISQLRIPGGTLAASSTYVVSLTVSMSDDVSQQSSSQMVISVGSLPLIARIKGSASRLQSTLSALALDARVSSDPDLDATADQGLAFKWACKRSDGISVSSQSCRDTTGALLSLGNSSTLHVAANKLPATTDAPYEFTVTVSKTGKSPATYTLSLTLVTQDIPNVELAVSGEFFRQADGSIKINANSVFSLTSSCSTTSAKTQAWSTPQELALTAPAFTASAEGDALIYKGEGGNALVAGASYLLTSSCTVAGAGEAGTVVGSAEQVVVVNSPPAGVPCETCLVDGNDGAPCVETGEPVFDLFRISCDNWADTDGGLEYRFGYQVEGDDKDVLFDWNESPSVDMRLPTGTINLKAQVRDELGALSAIMSSTVTIAAGGAGRRRLLAAPSDNEGARASYSDYSAGGRRLLLAAFDWPNAVALLDEQLLGGNYDRLNNQASSLILEVDSQYAAKTLAAAEALEKKDTFFTKLAAAAVTVNTAKSMSEGYMCASLNLASTISSNPAHLSTALVGRMLDHVSILVSDQHSSVASIPTACASSALSFMANVFAFQKQSNISATDLSSHVATVEQGLVSVLRETAAGLIDGAASLASSNSSSTAIARNTYAGRAWAAASLATADHVAHTTVSYAMPTTFENDVNLDATHAVDVLIGAFFAVPAFGGVAPVGPLVTLLVSQNGVNVSVASLSQPINISIPFTAAHSAAGGESRCVYVNGSAFSDAGVTTMANADASGVVCRTTHLTSFTVVQETNTTGNTTRNTTGDTTALTTTARPTPSTTALAAVADMTTAAVKPTTTPAPTNSAPSAVKADFTTYVEMVVSLPFTALEFTPSKQTSFRTGVASAAGVASSSVEITAIKEVDSRRAASRALLATSVEIAFRVAAADAAAAESLAGKLDATSLNNALEQQGLPAATVIRGATVFSGGKEVASNVGAIIGGVVGGVVGLLLVAAAMFCYNRSRKRAAQTSGPKTPSPTNAAPSQPTAPSFAVSPSQLAPQHQDAELGREGGKGAGGEGAVPAGGSFHSTGEEELNPGRISLEMQVDGLQVESTASLVRELVDHAAGAMTTHPGLAGLQVGTGGQHVTSDVVYASSIPPRPGPPALVDVPSSGIPETAFARHRDVEPLPPALQGYADHTEYAQGSTIVDC